MPVEPVRAGGSDAVEHFASVVTEIHSGEGDSAIGGEFVGVEEDAGDSAGGIDNVDDVLGLETGVVAVECALALADGDVEPFIVDTAEEFVEKLLSVRDLAEVTVREFALCGRPGFDIGGGDGLFEPAVGVGDGDSVVGVGLVDGFCGRVCPVLGEHGGCEEGWDHGGSLLGDYVITVF